ncbi:MAG: glycosyltransferase, partial [Fimbriimonadaceae bacterium]|nr:glycosyltransferase [Fimbriimonadaceae bacterium]
NTGGADLYEDGKEGFIVPIRDADALRNRLQQLSEDHDLRNRMVNAGLERVKAMAGWDQYGDRVCAEISALVAQGKFTEGTS